VKQTSLGILLLGSALTLLSPAVHSQQPQKLSHPAQEDRMKSLETRVDAAERATSAATMEKEYITRVQKQYESYYQKVLNTQMWTLGIMGLILTVMFVLVARFSLRMIDEHIKTGTAGATVQMRNEYARALAKETQKLWDSNAADIKKLKEVLTTHIAELEQNLKERSGFQMQFVQGLAEAVDERRGESLNSFRSALRIYKSGKSRNIVEPKFGATAARWLLESIRKTSGENHLEKTREELADALYNGLEEELALAALECPWLAPMIQERTPTPEATAAPASEPLVEPRSGPSLAAPLAADSDVPLDEESDSCRLITT
jgi:hypothetical protein